MSNLDLERIKRNFFREKGFRDIVRKACNISFLFLTSGAGETVGILFTIFRLSSKRIEKGQ